MFLTGLWNLACWNVHHLVEYPPPPSPEDTFSRDRIYLNIIFYSLLQIQKKFREGLISRNFADAKFNENKIPAKLNNHCRSLLPFYILNLKACLFT